MLNSEIVNFIASQAEQQFNLYNIENVEIKYINLLSKKNSFVSVDKNLKQYKIYFNLNVFKKLENPKFYLYNSLLHEIEHIKTMELTKRDNFYSYEHLLSIMEYCNFINPKKLNKTKEINLSCFNKIRLISFMKSNYNFSTTEIKSNLEAYKGSIKKYKLYLTNNELEKYKLIIESLELLNDLSCISYNFVYGFVNKFTCVLINTQNILINHPEILKEYKILQNLFNEKGYVKNIYDIYLTRNDLNADMIDKLVLNLLFTINEDLTSYLYDSNFKKYLEKIISDYNYKVMNFIKNKEKANVFIDDKKIIKSNLEIMKKNISILRALINKYNLKRNSGYVLSYKSI